MTSATCLAPNLPGPLNRFEDWQSPETDTELGALLSGLADGEDLDGSLHSDLAMPKPDYGIAPDAGDTTLGTDPGVDRLTGGVEEQATRWPKASEPKKTR